MYKGPSGETAIALLLQVAIESRLSNYRSGTKAFDGNSSWVADEHS